MIPDRQSGIRPWRREDLEIVRRITWQTWQATYASFIPGEDMQLHYDRYYSRVALAESFTASGVFGFIGLRADDPVGYARVRLDRKDGEGYLSSLYILPSFQGGGLGAALLEAAEDWVERQGRERIGVGVMTRNRRALHWYERRGFRFDREEPFPMGRTAVAHRLGWKPLAGIPSVTEHPSARSTEP